jgi:predicted amidohydrolase
MAPSSRTPIPFRIALANLRFPATPKESITHEKAALCRAAENSCWFATVNYASAGSPTTSAIVRPDGTLISYQPYGAEGLLIADIDITAATGRFAARCRY